MIGRWWQDAVSQWRSSQRLRYAVLVGLVVVALHGILKIADQRDAVAKDWARDEALRARLRSVVAEPRWKQRAVAAEQLLRQRLAAIPFAPSKGAARANEQAWLAEVAKRSKFADAKVTVEDALSVPRHRGLIQVVSRLEVAGSPWHFAPLLQAVGQQLPWRQAHRVEIAAVEQGKMVMVMRSYYRDAEFAASLGEDAESTDARVEANTSPAAEVRPASATASQAAVLSTRAANGNRATKPDSVARPVLPGPDGVLAPITAKPAGAQHR